MVMNDDTGVGGGELFHDLYATLGVDRQANEKELRKAYKRLALKLHPDKHKTAEEKAKASNAFLQMKDAYETLMDPVKRKQYDTKQQETREKQQQQHNSCRPTKPCQNDGRYKQPRDSSSASSPFGSRGTRCDKPQSQNTKGYYRPSSSHASSKPSSMPKHTYKDYHYHRQQSQTRSNSSSSTPSPPPRYSYTSYGTSSSASASRCNESHARQWQSDSHSRGSAHQHEQSKTRTNTSKNKPSPPPRYSYTYGTSSSAGASFSDYNAQSSSREPQGRSNEPNHNRHHREREQSQTRSSASRKPKSRPRPDSFRSSPNYGRSTRQSAAKSFSSDRYTSNRGRQTVFGVRQDGKPCQRCIQQGCYCYQHHDQDPNYASHHPPGRHRSRHSAYQGGFSSSSGGGKVVFGINLNGQPCRRCINMRGFCFQHTDQDSSSCAHEKKRTKSEEDSGIRNREQHAAYGIRKDGKPCTRCQKQGKFCFQHEWQQTL